ncbi:protease modulator HflC [Candidatus Endowatersipora endosymbiont of Watersipora subatra]|uniref:protease modulator HflC n=1 Tax=Candidatus Endowatersipora endosymbiont of Watersipora subatra TaxID=3077946 RepID=UPI00312C6D3E
MSNRSALFLGIIGLMALLFWGSVFVVSEREQAIVLRFGEIKRVQKKPGLFFKLPFSVMGLDSIQIVEDRLLRFDLDDIRVQVSGGKFYEVDAFMTYKISDPRRFREQVSASISSAESRLRTRLDAALRKTYGLRGFESALSKERTAMMSEVRSQIRPEADNLGIRIVDVRIRRTDLTREVSAQTYERMKAERYAESERLRARGQEAARRITAEADRQVVEIKAEAQREAEILRGQGEGERNSIFANAFNKDPEFFEFYRSMAAYRTALQSSNTTFLLSPNSEFFRFFKDSHEESNQKSQQ